MTVWRTRADEGYSLFRATDDEKKAQSVVTLPVYLNSSRTELLFTVDLEATDVKQAQSFYERGVAILCSYSLG